MNDKKLNNAILLLGSNIDPEKNIIAALKLLGDLQKQSHIWKTKSYGADGPDFLNMAVEIQTDLNLPQLKESLIGCIEKMLHRTRTENKNAPRTIDIDIIVFNSEVTDDDVWQKPFVAIPVAEIIPDLINDKTGGKLIEVAKKIQSSTNAELYKNEIL